MVSRPVKTIISIGLVDFFYYFYNKIKNLFIISTHYPPNFILKTLYNIAKFYLKIIQSLNTEKFIQISIFKKVKTI